MPRVKRGVTAKKKHKKVLKQAKGYYGARSRVFRVAKQAVIKAAQYSYRDRRVKKRQMRSLWIIRIGAACKQFDISYSKLIHGLKVLEIDLNRKMLSEIAIHDIATFEQLVDKVKAI
ncbi:MAG: 50S ribosomal protein L20 [Legionellales bacterium]|jgi:large subunit ribosomal protein L20|nr:50S ribosomal protein L20 [Legionellales bacterium]